MAFGQTSRLALKLRTEELKVSDFLGLKMRPSRKKVKAGLMIDDFVIFKTMDKKGLRQLGGKPSPGAEVLKWLHDESSGAVAEWRVLGRGDRWRSGNGEAMFEASDPSEQHHLVQLGKASVGLLELVAGALCFVFQVRRSMQKELPLVKPYLSSSWSLVSQWELAEPVQHRTPMPEPLLRAAVCIALGWGWPTFAATLMAGFYGICRIGEVLRAS